MQSEQSGIADHGIKIASVIEMICKLDNPAKGGHNRTTSK